ncbi:MAG: hypothetical protein PVG22_09250 [Chromatiales bacterium]|jgi:hypothetical protein
MIQNTQSLPSTLYLRLREAFVRGIIWGFIGSLYGMLFVIFAALSAEWEIPLPPYLFAGVLAGTIGALIYSSMRLAVLMAIIISPVCAILMVFSSTPIAPHNLVFIIGTVGAVAGALYGRFTKNSRVYRADAKTLTGFTSGLLVSLVYVMFSRQLSDLPMGVVVGIMCPITGFIYVSLAPTFIRTFGNLLPRAGDGALVGVGVAVFLTLCNFVMVHSIDIDSTGAFHELVHHVQALMPQAIFGGLIGGVLGGFVSSQFFNHWQDL